MAFEWGIAMDCSAGMPAGCLPYTAPACAARGPQEVPAGFANGQPSWIPQHLKEARRIVVSAKDLANLAYESKIAAAAGRHGRQPRTGALVSPAATQTHPQQGPSPQPSNARALLDATQRRRIARSAGGVPEAVPAMQPQPAEFVRPEEADAARPAQPFGIADSALGPMTPEQQELATEPVASSAIGSGAGEEPADGGRDASDGQQARALIARFGPIALHMLHALMTLLCADTTAQANQHLDEISQAPDLKCSNARHAAFCCTCQAHLDLVAYSGQRVGKGDLFCLAHRQPGHFMLRLESHVTLGKLRYFLRQAEGVRLHTLCLGRDPPHQRTGYLVEGLASVSARDALDGISRDLLQQAAAKLDLEVDNEEDLVDQLMAAVAAGQYLDINIDPRAGVPLHPAIKNVCELRAAEEETLTEVAAELLSADKCSTTLVILGQKGRGTPFHMDSTEALNIAYAVKDAELVSEQRHSKRKSKKGTLKPLACWCLVHPLRILTALAAIKNIVGERSDSETILTEAELHELARQVGKDRRGNDYVRIIKQLPGGMVYVPPGWMHQVFNYAPCIKFAWDLYCPEKFALYIKVWLEVKSRVHGLRQSDDYMAPTGVLVNTVCSLVDRALLSQMAPVNP